MEGRECSQARSRDWSAAWASGELHCALWYVTEWRSMRPYACPAYMSSNAIIWSYILAGIWAWPLL